MNEKIEAAKSKILACKFVERLKSNPAFETILDEILRIVPQGEFVIISENPQKYGYGISLEWGYKSDYTNSYVSLAMDSAGTFTASSLTREKKVFNGTGNQYYHFCSKYKVSYDENTKGIKSKEVSTLLSASNPREYNCDVYGSEKEQLYDEHGIMTYSEYKQEKHYSSKDFSLDSIGFFDRWPIDEAVINKVTMWREGLDFARISKVKTLDDGEKMGYRSKTRLSSEHGLRKMEPIHYIEEYPEDVVIPKMTEEEIQALIEKEPDPKVREGLVVLAQGRENFYYDSNYDPYFSKTGTQRKKTI